jgi:hypothetical protein
MTRNGPDILHESLVRPDLGCENTMIAFRQHKTMDKCMNMRDPGENGYSVQKGLLNPRRLPGLKGLRLRPYRGVRSHLRLRSHYSFEWPLNKATDLFSVLPDPTATRQFRDFCDGT